MCATVCDNSCMTTTQRIRNRAADLGYTWDQQSLPGGREVMTVFPAGTQNIKMCAQFAQGKFEGGYVVDRLGHVVSCDTVTDLIRFAQ